MKELTLGKIYSLYNFIEAQIPIKKICSFVVTIPLVAWRNSSGQFLNLDITHNGTLSFSNGEEHVNSIIPKSEQLFLFAPHPGNHR